MQRGATKASQLRKIRALLTAILVLMAFGAAYFAKAMLLPIVLGLLLALTLSPLVRTGSRLGIPAVITSGALILGMAASLALFVAVMGGQLTAWVDDVPRMGSEIRYKLSSVLQSVEAVKDASEEVEEIASGTGDDVEKVVVQGPALLTSAVSNAASFAMSLGVGMVLALFLLASGDMFYVKLVQSFPRLADKKRALKIVYTIERQISHYLLAITSINAGLGVAVGTAMYLLEMPYPVIWGILAFSLNYVPFIGALVGVAINAAVSIVTFDSLAYALVPPLAYQALTALEGQLVTPYLLGRRLELNTVSVFVTVIFWAWLWGIPGALMAVPALVVLKVIADNVEAMATLSNFLSDRGASAMNGGSE